MRNSPHVLIVGAGLAGMTLAQALRKKGITFEIFERDAGIHARFQGWAIALHKILPDLQASLPDDLGDIHTTSHLNPLDLEAQFKYYVGDQLASTGESTPGHPLIRANRNALRDYLDQHLDVQWGKMWTNIEEGPDGVTLHFDDGTSTHGDILVGADGVNSKVRKHILPGQNVLNNLPLGLVIGETKLSREEYSQAMSLGHSMYISANEGGTQRMMTALNSVDPSGTYANYYWTIAWTDHNLNKEGLPETYYMSKEDLYAKAKEHTSTLDPKFTRVLDLTKPDDLIHPPLVIRDIVLDSLPVSRITLVGDAAHAMTPFRGEGGNLALQDSLDLARTIDGIRSANSEHGKMLELLGEYQVQMLKRSRPVVLASRAAAVGDQEARPSNFDNWAGKYNSSYQPDDSTTPTTAA